MKVKNGGEMSVLMLVGLRYLIVGIDSGSSLSLWWNGGVWLQGYCQYESTVQEFRLRVFLNDGDVNDTITSSAASTGRRGWSGLLTFGFRSLNFGVYDQVQVRMMCLLAGAPHKRVKARDAP